jgi:hypothetical protein
MMEWAEIPRVLEVIEYGNPSGRKTYSRKLVVGEMVRMLPKLSMNTMSKMSTTVSLPEPKRRNTKRSSKKLLPPKGGSIHS